LLLFIIGRVLQRFVSLLQHTYSSVSDSFQVEKKTIGSLCYRNLISYHKMLFTSSVRTIA